MLLFFLSTPAVFAAQDKHLDPAELPTVQVPPPLEVYWKERSGEILPETVCFNYPEDSKEYLGCRKLAAERFSAECNRYQRLYHDSRPYYDEEYERQMEKYCLAADRFSP